MGWTDEADAAYRRWALAGYTALGVLAVGVAALAVYTFITKPFK